MMQDKDLTDDVLDEIIAGAKTSMEQYLALSLKAERVANRQLNSQQNIPEIIPATQFKPVADLYEMQFDDGRTCAFHTDGAKAVQWLLTCDGNKVQEYVKLDRYQEALSGNSPVIVKAYDIEAFGIFSANEGEDGLLLQIEQFLFGTENCPQIGKENMVPKFALQAIINRLQAHCNSMGEDTLIDIFASSAAPQQEDK